MRVVGPVRLFKAVVYRLSKRLFLPAWFKRICRRAQPMLDWFEARALYDFARENVGLGAIVEVGSCFGGTACLLSLASKSVGGEMVYCVDLWPELVKEKNFSDFDDSLRDRGFAVEEGPLFELFLEHVKANGAPGFIAPIKSDSAAAGVKWGEEWGAKPIKLLFIDGGHDYETVAGDIRAWGPFLARGGIIAFHDYKFNPQNGIKRAVNELIVASGRFSKLSVVSSLAWARKI